MSFLAACIFSCISLNLSLPKEDRQDIDDLYNVGRIVEVIGLSNIIPRNKEILLSQLEDSFKQDCLFCEEIIIESFESVGYFYDFEYTTRVTKEYVFEYLDSEKIQRLNFWLSSPLGQKFLTSGGLATLNLETELDRSRIFLSRYEYENEVENFVKSVFTKKLLSELGSLWDSPYQDVLPHNKRATSKYGAPINFLEKINNLDDSYSSLVLEQKPYYMSRLRNFTTVELRELSSFFRTDLGQTLSKIYIYSMAEVFANAVAEAVYIQNSGSKLPNTRTRITVLGQ